MSVENRKKKKEKGSEEGTLYKSLCYNVNQVSEGEMMNDVSFFFHLIVVFLFVFATSKNHQWTPEIHLVTISHYNLCSDR